MLYLKLPLIDFFVHLISNSLLRNVLHCQRVTVCVDRWMRTHGPIRNKLTIQYLSLYQSTGITSDIISHNCTNILKRFINQTMSTEDNHTHLSKLSNNNNATASWVESWCTSFNSIHLSWAAAMFTLRLFHRLSLSLFLLFLADSVA